MRTTIGLERDENDAWKNDPAITVSHDEPLTEQQIEAFRDVARAALESVAEPQKDIA